MNSTWRRFGVWVGSVVGLLILVKISDIEQLQAPRRPLPPTEGAWIVSPAAPVPEGKPIDEVNFEFDVTSDHTEDY